ncbi:MAG: hypothetical protein KDD64_07565 [Bdellovibrionales bacterium]|nr:hypothetical protein [Bdellovibrionales bacterium]
MSLQKLLRLWFGLREPVTPRAYLSSGVGLFILKYLGEASLYYHYSGGLTLSPLQFLSPLASHRLGSSHFLTPPIYLFALTLWSLPFLWVGLSMSVRRALNAGFSPWVGFGLIVPLWNFGLMLILSLAPERPAPLIDQASHQSTDTYRSILVSLLYGALLALLGALLAYFGYSNYATVLFVGFPTAIGALASYSYNQSSHATTAGSIKISLLALLCASSIVLLFALEGVFCMLMAFPFVAVGALLGGLLGRTIALRTKPVPVQIHFLTSAIVLVGLIQLERLTFSEALRQVTTETVIEAPIDRVWENVVAFPEIDPPTSLLFRTGIAYPIRARIEGVGVGAIRYCEFSTGAFVEPITVWDAPHRLAFDVRKQPKAMEEFSVWGQIHPEHLFTFPKSQRGQFKLTQLPHDRVLLQGTTWYQVGLKPSEYWGIWADYIIGHIHQRVLDHIRIHSEKGSLLIE